MNLSHTEILAAFYTRIIPRALPDELRDNFYEESDRRIREISGNLWRYWPISSAYAFAKYGDDYVLGVSSGFLHSLDGCTVWESVQSSLFKWVDLKQDIILINVIRYECLFFSKLRKNYDGDFKVFINNKVEIYDAFSLDCFDFDIVNIFKIFRIYQSANAPMYMWKSVNIIESDMIIVSYIREGNIFSKNITNIFDATQISLIKKSRMLYERN